MKSISVVPDALHICPLCEELTSGPELCAECRQFRELADYLNAQLHAKRANDLFSTLPRVDAGDAPARSRWLDCAMLAAFLLYGVIVVGGFGWVFFQVVRWLVR